PHVVRIAIDLTGQHLVAYLSNGRQRDITVSTGKGVCGTRGNPCAHPVRHSSDNCTPTGDFTVQSRRGQAWHGSDGLMTPDHAMAYYVGFADDRGIGIHNSQTANGTPLSHGCVRVGRDASPTGFAAWLNARVRVGETTVVVDGVAQARPHPCPAEHPRQRR